MPTLAEYLKGTFDDSLKKVVQPAGLLPAALFVLLNLAFIQPAAKRHEVGVAQSYAGLADASTVVVVAATIALLGFVLVSASGNILDTLSGRTWRSSLLARWRVKRRDDARTKLRDECKREKDETSKTELDWKLRTRYAPHGSPSAPTALGDVFAAYEHSATDRYGLRLAALWEPLRGVVKADDPAGKSVADEKSSLDLMANLTLVIGVFAAEAMVLFSLWSQPGPVLLAASTIVVAFVAYKVTITKALSWCDAIDTVLVLYIDDLLEEMATRKTSSLSDRRKLLGELSEFLLRGGPSDALFEDAVTPAPAAAASAGVEVEVTVFAGREPEEPDAAAPAHRGTAQYLLVVGRTERSREVATRAVVTLSDAAQPHVRGFEALEGPEPTILRDAGGAERDTLVWELGSLAWGEGRVLRGEVDRWRVAVSEPLSVTVLDVDDATLLVSVENPSEHAVQGAHLTTFHCLETEERPLEPTDPDKLGLPSPDGRARRWRIDELGPGETLPIAFERLATEDEDGEDENGDDDYEDGADQEQREDAEDEETSASAVATTTHANTP